MRPMRALVTGGAGFIGSHLVERLVGDGHVVTVVDALRYSGRSSSISHCFGPDCHLEVFDICNGEAVLDVLRRKQINTVFHLAAETHVTRSIEAPHIFTEANVVGTATMLAAAVEWWRGNSDFLFIHVSTDEVYGSLGEDTASLFSENSPYDPRNPYAASKAASDHMVRAYSNTFGLPAIVTHCSNNYGSRQHPEKLIPTIIRQIQTERPVTLHGDGMHVRDWLHVKDHADGLVQVSENGRPGETYNFGGVCELTNRAIVSLVCVALGRDEVCPIEYVEDRPGNDRRYGTDITKATKLGWYPSRTIHLNLPLVVQWYLDHPAYADSYGI
jgi:dTDP-glucose 4,6-dehydratase